MFPFQLTRNAQLQFCPFYTYFTYCTAAASTSSVSISKQTQKRGFDDELLISDKVWKHLKDEYRWDEACVKLWSAQLNIIMYVYLNFPIFFHVQNLVLIVTVLFMPYLKYTNKFTSNDANILFYFIPLSESQRNKISKISTVFNLICGMNDERRMRLIFLKLSSHSFLSPFCRFFEITYPSCRCLWWHVLCASWFRDESIFDDWWD